VPAVESLMLRFGPSAGLTVIQSVAAFLGVLAIVVSSADMVWKLGACSLLVFVARRVHAASISKSQSGWFELLQDGTARMNFDGGRQSHSVLKENAWAIRWLCVLTLFEPESGRHYHCVVCASENPPDEYRRLLRHLNMSPPAANQQKAMRW
jgi:hypothetical protein